MDFDEKENELLCDAGEKKENNDIKDQEKGIKKRFVIKLVIINVVIIIVVLSSALGYILYNNYKNQGTKTLAKPIIYIYPTVESEVSVILGIPENLTHTYPKYNGMWNVKANPNGDLIDIESGRTLYSLYWEGIKTVESSMGEGFVIEGINIISFLEEKLEILGLTEREANEFIIYWLPELEKNKYNYIRFQTIEEIDANMPLKVTPTPDTVIRVMMEFKVLNEKIDIKEQILETPIRSGFVVVEWGGTEIK